MSDQHEPLSNSQRKDSRLRTQSDALSLISHLLSLQRLGWGQHASAGSEHERHDPVDERERDHDADRDGDATPNEPSTKLLEMLEEPHTATKRLTLIVWEQLDGKSRVHVGLATRVIRCRLR